MICNHWQVAIVPFPFMDKPAVKRRPALVISGKEFNAANDHSVMAMITSSSLDSWPSDYAILNSSAAGLMVNCYVRWKIFTIPNELIVRIAGDLDDEDREALTIQARTIFIRA